MTNSSKIRVGILFGGRSREHEVSLSSARSILQHIDTAKYDVECIGITHSGNWVAGDDAQNLLNGKQPQFCEMLYLPTTPADGCFVAVTSDSEGAITQFLKKLDVVFPVLHGPYGEDGTLQGLLEMAGIPYVGAGVASSAVCMDKVLMKQVFISGNISTPPFEYFLRKAWKNDKTDITKVVEHIIGFPCFVKPSNTGSSVGISKVDNVAGFEKAFNTATEYDRKIVVEKAVDAREIECSVLGNDEPKVSVLGEIIPSKEFYDYNAKYIDDTSELIIPAEFPDKTAQLIQDLAIQAYKAVDCAGMARVDFLVDRTTDEVFVNELNTLPGFTSISMYSKLWEASGLSYQELITQLIELAFERSEDSGSSKVVYTPEVK